MEKIHFSSSVTIESFQNQPWNIGDSYEVEFFTGKSVPVFLFDANSDLEEPIATLSKDNTIFVNFEYSHSYNPPIRLFVFCCSSGVYIFKQSKSKGNVILRNFLRASSHKQFIGFKTKQIFPRLKKLFYQKFFMNYTNILPNLKETSIDDLILKYAGNATANFSLQDLPDNDDDFSMKQILSEAFYVYALSLSYSNFPPEIVSEINNSQKSKDGQIITEKVESDQINTENDEFPKEEKTNDLEDNDFISIDFVNGFIPRKIPKKSPVNSKYKVKFYSDEEYVQIYLLDANSDIQQYVDLMSKDPVIFAGFESSKSKKNAIPINVFSFYCSSGIFIFQSTKKRGNPQLGEFLRAKASQKFYTFGIFGLFSDLHQMFGEQLNFNIEDIYRTHVLNGQLPKLYNFVEYFAGKPLVDRSVLKVKSGLWSEKVLTVEQIMRASYVPYSLSKSLPNLPTVKGQVGRIYFDQDDGHVLINNTEGGFMEEDDKDVKFDEAMDYGKISFSHNPLSSFKKSFWNMGATAEIEFFPGTFSKVYLLDAVKDFEKFAPQIANGDDVIFIDFEYVPLERKEAAPVCLFQFCNSSGAFLFRQRTNKVNKALKKFMSKENGLKFVAKGIPGDMARLRLYFGDDFRMNIEDVEVTRLMPYKESRNFEKMVSKFAGKSTEKFKDKKISCSNWNAKNLRKIQVIYSAFDVVALYRCYPNFPKVSRSQYRQPGIEQFDIKRKLAKRAVSLKKFDRKDLTNSEKVDSCWDENSELFIGLIGTDYDVLKFTVLECVSTIGNSLLCGVCQSYSNCSFRKFLEHCQKSHFDEKSQKGDKICIKKLFMRYLDLTGRIKVDDLNCLLCGNKAFGSEEELCQHCWNSHYRETIEFLPKKKKGEKKTDEDEDVENENDQDDDDTEKDSGSEKDAVDDNESDNCFDDNDDDD